MMVVVSFIEPNFSFQVPQTEHRSRDDILRILQSLLRLERFSLSVKGNRAIALTCILGDKSRNAFSTASGGRTMKCDFLFLLPAAATCINDKSFMAHVIACFFGDWPR